MTKMNDVLVLAGAAAAGNALDVLGAYAESKRTTPAPAGSYMTYQNYISIGGGAAAIAYGMYGKGSPALKNFLVVTGAVALTRRLVNIAASKITATSGLGIKNYGGARSVPMSFPSQMGRDLNVRVDR